MKSTIAVVLAAALAMPAWSNCIGDINGDRVVDGVDLGTLLAQWGPCESSPCGADLDGNGLIDGVDLGLLVAAWGDCAVTVPGWATLIEAEPDPLVVPDPAWRAAIRATGLAWRVRHRQTGIELLLIPGGAFDMGCTLGSAQYGCTVEEQPVHHVTLTNPFYLGRYEVTQAQWLARVGSNPSQFADLPDSSNRPVERVTWSMVVIQFLRDQIRLPTEAEWEFACRAGTQTPFSNGSTDDSSLGSIAWYADNSPDGTHAVGGRAANGFGLHDMLGNVWEWVHDRWSGYPSTPQVNPSTPPGGSQLDRVFRGGDWTSGSGVTRASFRTPIQPGLSSSVGFRIAMSP